MNPNREHLDQLIERFQYWLHIEDPRTLWTIVATKVSHKLPGDPVWIMLVGPSSDGKSEILRSFVQDGEQTVDDLTVNTFVSGYRSKATDDEPHFAELLKDRMWYIFDMSILLSKKNEIRSELLSQLRMIYDGQLEKRYGNKVHITADTSNNTLIVGSTPAIDSTMLEDQILGTRFITYRLNTKNNMMVMEKIDTNLKDMAAMRGSLKAKVFDYFTNVKVEDIDLTDQELRNIKILTEQTRILRTSVELDKNKEIRNIAYPEGAGRLYKQLLKLYKAYRVIGLTETEATDCIRKICIDNINPVRMKILNHMVDHNDNFSTTSEVARNTKLGKGSCKGHLFSMTALDIIQYDEVFDTEQKRMVDQWLLVGGDFNLLLGLKPEADQLILS